MEKIWLKSYPPGVPAEIKHNQYRSIINLLEESFQKYQQRDAAICLDQHMSYGEMDQYSRQLAAWLQNQGLQRGARVALMMPNLLQYPVAICAVLRAGMTVVNVNPLYTPRELEHQLNDSGAEVIIILENFATTLQQVLGKTGVKHVILASVGDMLGIKGLLVNFVVRHVHKQVPEFDLPKALRFNQVLAQGAKMNFQRVECNGDDVAFLQYTGGTTGVSKGATLLHRNIVANLMQGEAWLAPKLSAGNGTENFTIVCALPLYHIFALTGCFFLAARIGAVNLLIPNPRDMPKFVKTLSKYKFNMLPGVNTLYNGLLNQPDFAKLDFSNLRICNGGGTAVQEAVNDRWKAATGCFIIEGYGLSETSPLATCNRADASGFTNTVGLPVPSTEVVILDDDEKPVPQGERGEIAIRGPQVMAGYWQRPDETAKVMTRDGFFKTGDIGIMDAEGYIKIVDRKKDMILVSGFNVYPNEIEAVLAGHPGIMESACIGVPDADSGEAVKVFIVRKDPNLSKEDVLEYCKQNLTGYKKPKHIEFRNELPKTPVGKILRRELRDK
ncbi:long-chain-fatty-acid--CoA ligase [Massilia sp. W12]|uniref:long-chain-fatty-acid--CoA ligase n=1 Tax=Massilia sp. W12 TaxID=3126507 RepID=UPI0030CF82D1